MNMANKLDLVNDGQETITKERIRIRNIIKGYISGFFDAEGTIGFVEESGTASISFKQTYRPVLEQINCYIKSGTVSKYIPKNENKISFRLRVSHEEAPQFLEYIIPNLIEKKEQAKVLLYYLKTYKEPVRNYYKLSEIQKQQRKFVADELKRLKHEQYNEKELKNYENELKLLKIPKDIREGKQATLLELKDLYKELGIANCRMQTIQTNKDQIHNMTEDVLLGYLTGFYDGEGHVGIQKGKRDSYTIRTVVTNSNFDILNIYKDKYGGKIRPKTKDKTVKENYKNLWLWELINNETLQFLKAIYPWSKVKKEQIYYATKFQEWHDWIGIIKTVEQKKKAEFYRLKLVELKKETGENIEDEDGDVMLELVDKNQKDINNAWL